MPMSPAPEHRQMLRASLDSAAKRAPFGIGFFAIAGMLIGGVGFAASTLLLFLAYHHGTFAALDAFEHPADQGYLPEPLLTEVALHDQQLAAIDDKSAQISVVLQVAGLLISLYLFVQGSRCWRLRPNAHRALAYGYIAMLIALALGHYATWQRSAAIKRTIQSFEDRTDAFSGSRRRPAKAGFADDSPGWMYRKWQNAQDSRLEDYVLLVYGARYLFYLVAAFYLLNPGLDYVCRTPRRVRVREKIVIPPSLLGGDGSEGQS